MESIRARRQTCSAALPSRSTRRTFPLRRVGAYYAFELLDATCVDEKHGELGRIEAVREDGGGWLLVVRGGGVEVLIPFVESMIVELDRERRILRLRLPEGLLEACASPVLTLFPELFEAFLATSLVGKAIESGLLTVEVVDLRRYAADRHHTVDDVAYGGGGGMVLKAPVVLEALRAVERRTDALAGVSLASGPAPGRGPGARTRASGRTWSCCAGGTKGSTNALWRSASTRKSRSATSCSPAEKCRR